MVTEISLSNIQTMANDKHAGQDNGRPRASTGRERLDLPAAVEATRTSSVKSAPILDMSALESAVDDIAKTAQNIQRSLQFSVDEVSGEIVITVIDKETDEVIRRIPHDEVRALSANLGLGPGALVEDKA